MTERESQYPFEKKWIIFKKFKFVSLARERPRLPCVKGAVKNLLIFD